MPIDFEEDVAAPKIDFEEEKPSQDTSSKPDFVSRLFSALGRAPAAQREEANIQTEFAAKDSPLVNVSPELVKTLSGNLTALSMISPDAAKGVSEEVANAATSLSKPSNIALAGAALVAPEVVGGVLAGMGAKSAGEAAGEASVAIQQGNTEESARLLTRAGLSAGQAAIGPAIGLKGVRGEADILPASEQTVSDLEKGVGAPPISAENRLLPAPRTRMPEFQDSTLGLDRNRRALPAPGESEATAGLLPESPLGPRTAGYRIKVPPFTERPIIELDPATPEAVDNLRNVVRISSEAEPTGAEPFKPPTVSTDLRQLQAVMQRNSVSTLENWADGVIKEKLSNTSANPYLDPEFLSAALVKATVLVKRGAEKVADITAPMVDQFGRDIIPHLPALYKSASEAAGSVSSEPRSLPLDSPTVLGTSIPTPSAGPTQSAFGTTSTPMESFSDSIRNFWHGFANEALPRITESDKGVGEAGVRAVTSQSVGRNIGEIFADKVLRESAIDPKEFGAFAVEDNLRWREQDFRTKAEEALKKGDTEDAATLTEAADAVGTIVGAEGSPFQTHQDWLDYWERPEVQDAAARHIDMWKEQKDPLFRQANDLDPETPLASRGLISGMRVNMKGIAEGEKSPTALPVKDSAAGMERVGQGEEPARGGTARSTLIRQMATLKKSDPFNRTFTGLSPAYEADYYELMRNGFGREMPVSAQHEFIRKMIASGDAVVSDKSFEPEMTLKGDKVVGRLLKLNPWSGGPTKFLQVREPLAAEYDNVTGMVPRKQVPVLTKAGDILTRASVAGLAEGTTHMGNLLTQVMAGAGPTSNPLLNGLIKSLGRVDLLYSIPKVFIDAVKADKSELADIMSIGASKEPYSRVDPAAPKWRQFMQEHSLSKVLDLTDKGVRLGAARAYDNFVTSGWITEASETAKREYVNQVGNYNRKLQPQLLRDIRDTVNPFVTATHTFTVQGLRRMAGSAGVRDLTPSQRVAFAADIYGGVVGTVTFIAGMNWLLNHNDDSVKEKVFGPTGTKLGEIGWKDEEGKLRTINALRISGFERGLRATGILPAAEAIHRGLGANGAIDSAGQSIANTGVSYLTGPGVRFGSVALTGKTPSVPSFQEAPIVAPQDDFNPLKTQIASNVGTALKEAHPLVDMAVTLAQGIHEGHTKEQLMDEVGKKQLSRYYPGQKTPVAQSEDFAEIVKKAQVNDFVDDIARRARKLPEDQRHQFVEDHTPDEIRVDVNKKLKRKGVFKPEK